MVVITREGPMRTAEERIEKVHRRVKALERQRVKQQLAGFGSASAVLVVVLAVVMQRVGGLSISVTEDPYAGSSLLSESAGGYVLAAVIAFFIGVILTVVCLRYRRR